MSNTKVGRKIFCPGANRGDGGWVSLRAYVRAVQLAKNNPDMLFSTGLTCWWACTGKEIVRQFRRGLHDRINQNIPCAKRGVV